MYKIESEEVLGLGRTACKKSRPVLWQYFELVPLSLCPGTRAGANVPGQTPLSRDVPGHNSFPKRTQKTGKGR